MTIVLGVTAAPAARAQTSGDKATAEALYQQGHDLVEKGDYEHACPKLAESLRLDPGIGVMLHLASCWEKSGKTASAWAQYREAEQVAVRSGDSRADVARKRADALEPRLHRLTVTVAAPVDGLALARDGAPVGAAQWGTAVPVDPGEHVIVAVAPGKQRWEGKVVTPDQAGASTITVPALADAATSAAPPPATGAPPAVASTNSGTPDAPPELSPASGMGTQRILALVAGGVGVVGVGVGSVFGILTKSKLDQSNSQGCNASTNHCNQTGASLRSDAQSDGTISTVSFIVGAVALAGGAALWFTAPNPASPTVGGAITPGGGAISVQGVW
jgi:serine/threonine-protein kinase